MPTLVANESVHHEEAEGDAYHPTPCGITEGTEDRHEEYKDEGEKEGNEQDRYGPLAYPRAGVCGAGRRRARLGRACPWRGRPGSARV